GGGCVGACVHGSGGSGVPPPQPVVTMSNGNATVSDIAALGSVTVTLDNKTYQISDVDLHANYTILNINGQLYTIYPNTTIPINNTLLYLRLLQLQFPYGGRHSVSFSVYHAQQPSPTELFGINYLPTYTSTKVGEITQSQLEIQNTWSTPEYVTLAAPQSFAGVILFSANSLYLTPGQSVSVNLEIRSGQDVQPGVYIVPIQISSTTAAGINTKETEYLSMDIYNGSSAVPSTATQINLLNNSHSITGTILVQSANNTGISNTMLQTILPIAVTDNISNIKAYGIQNNVSIVNGQYVIDWYLNYLPKHQQAYAYFTIDNPTSIPGVAFLKNTLVPTTLLQKRQSVNIVGVYLPTLYVDSSGKITVTGIYTNSTAQKVTFTLKGPSDIPIQNATQVINATLNQTITSTFTVQIGNITGTRLFYLDVSTPSGTNINDTLPVFIIQKPQYSITVPTNAASLSPQLQKNLELGAIAAVAIIAAIYLIMRISERSRRRSQREALDKLKSQITNPNVPPK
ncbi:MAG: hypothetical protein KGH62_04250, partial [Candidatus Micrarchaeota archaeon]|nr:hypothetical protein [Candidatus Micrarchaeota archaeon]